MQAQGCSIDDAPTNGRNKAGSPAPWPRGTSGHGSRSPLMPRSALSRTRVVAVLVKPVGEQTIVISGASTA